MGSSRFTDLRSVRWRINLGVLPSSLDSTIDDLRRITADSRRRYACLRRRLLVDPHITRFGNDSSDLVTDNPLSQNPDSTWGRFFRNAELEKIVDNDLSRLYPEHGIYFQTPGCQRLLRRILLLWCLRHPECGYRQGMHELLAPLIYVLHEDIQHLIKVRKLYEHHFVDKFDEDLLNESLGFNFKISSKYPEDNDVFEEKSEKHSSNTDLDPNLRDIVSLSDPYGADGELGIVVSEKFIEHDAYGMFDALMNGSGGDISMAKFFSHSSASATHVGLPPVIEASLSLYHLLSIVDPSLYSHLIELGVEPQYFALRWLRVLFGREFPLEDLLIIWDEIFSFSNSKSVTSEYDWGLSSSPRGAIISATAVSMMLNVRSSLLATELATSCLQRLLNFPERVDLDKIIGKAKSLVPLALDANIPSRSTPLGGNLNHVKQNQAKGRMHSLSFDSRSLNTPANVIPESYWEVKWRILQKEEETKKENCIQQASPKKRGWTEKIKSKLSRAESDRSLAKSERREQLKKPAVRRSLLEDLSRQLNAEEDCDENRHDNKFPFLDDPLHANSDVVVVDNNSGLGLSTASEEHSPVFSDPTSPLENDSEKSSTASNISDNIIDDETQNSSAFQSTSEEPPLPISDVPDLNVFGVFGGSDDVTSELSVVVPKEQKTLSEKFQWLWKFGRHNSGEETSDKKIEVENGKSDGVARLQRNKAETSVGEIHCNSVGLKTNGCDQNLVFALRNLGQSLLENVQVIESAFQSERNREGSQEQFSKHTLVGKGQVTAMSALKELRKISSLLREV
ncbi:hypothetical protein RND81_06G167600 [Saponaria officinalis]|uniref:Rab-GAP TBC domain-containing protein n=1 Tax=Saponaria officinalis TaxID=3572 RepID=A0AAW1KCI5_SAPOF